MWRLWFLLCKSIPLITPDKLKVQSGVRKCSLFYNSEGVILTLRKAGETLFRVKIMSRRPQPRIALRLSGVIKGMLLQSNSDSIELWNTFFKNKFEVLLFRFSIYPEQAVFEKVAGLRAVPHGTILY